MNYIEEKAKKLGISPEVYIFLRQSNRKIRYFTHDLKADTIIIDGGKVIFIPGREDSLDRLEDEGILFAAEEKSVEDKLICIIYSPQFEMVFTVSIAIFKIIIRGDLMFFPMTTGRYEERRIVFYMGYDNLSDFSDKLSATRGHLRSKNEREKGAARRLLPKSFVKLC